MSTRLLVVAITAALVAVASPAVAGEQLDASFGGDGVVVTSFGNGPSLGSRVAMLPTGRIAVAGLTGRGHSAVAVYRPNGALERRFGESGTVIETSVFEMGGLAVDDAGRIVLGGTTLGPHGGVIQVTRFLPSGALDPALGDGGIALIRILSRLPFKTDQVQVAVSDVVTQPDGTILLDAESHAFHGGTQRWLETLVRLNGDGTLDPTLGDDGVVLLERSGNPWAGPMVVRPDGSIIVAISVFAGGGRFGYSSGALVQFSDDGTYEGRFGRATGHIDYPNGSGDLEIAPDGSFVGVGKALQASSTSPTGIVWGWGIVRYRPDGSLDPTFAGDGTAVTVAGAGATGVAIEPDGRIAVAGPTLVDPYAPGRIFSVGLYRPNGSLDPSFGSDGIESTDIFNTNPPCAVAQDVALDLAGRIVASGYATPGACGPPTKTTRAVLARYEPGP